MTTGTLTPAALASYLDYALLTPTATQAEVIELCARAVQLGVFAVCVHPRFVRLAARELAGGPVAVCTVVGFPLGAGTSRIKAREAGDAVEDGAAELDMVLPLGAIKERDLAAIEEDVAVVVAAGGGKVPVKAILETCFLSEAEIVLACRVAVAAGAAFVKTSTGFGAAGARVAEVRLMRQTVGPATGVKASGGIKTLQDCLVMLAAGASRLGTSAAGTILEMVPENSPRG